MKNSHEYNKQKGKIELNNKTWQRTFLNFSLSSIIGIPVSLCCVFVVSIVYIEAISPGLLWTAFLYQECFHDLETCENFEP